MIGVVSPLPPSQCPNGVALREKEFGLHRFCLPWLSVGDQNYGAEDAAISELEKTNMFMSSEPLEPEGSASRSEGSVARAIAKYLEGDNSELGSMVLALHAQLLEKARHKLRNAPNLRSVTDAEGAVSSAMRSFWQAVENGKYRDMKHNNELLGLLITIVDRKAGRQIRKHSRIKAGGGKVINEPEAGLDAEGREPPPVDAAIEKETLCQMEAAIERWHDHMREKGLLDVAELILEGQGYRQIADKLTIREAKARRLITTVNTLTRAFGQEQKA